MFGYKSALAIAVAGCLAHGTLSLRAQSYPAQPVHLIVAFSAGGSVDTFGRIIAQNLGELWGQQVVVENRPGGLGNIGAVAAARAPADGYTLHMAASSIALNATLAPVPDFDPTRDFEPVMLVATAQDIFIVPIAAGISGFGAGTHLAISEFGRLTDTKFTIVPYRGGPPMLAAMISGEEVLIGFSDIVPALPLVQERKLIAIATPLLQRVAAAPDVPTIEEAGMPRIDVTSWNGIFIPKGTPAPIVALINSEVNRVFRAPEVRQRIEAIGQNPVAPMLQEQFASFVRAEIPRWRDIVRNAHIEIQTLSAQ